MNWLIKNLKTILLAMLCTQTCPSYALHLVTLNYPPLQYKNAKNEMDGPIPKMVCLILEKMHEPCTIEMYPWPRALRMVKNGTADAIFTAFKTTERETFLQFTEEPLMYQDIYLYGLNTKKINIQSDFSNLGSYKIGTTSTISYGEIFDQMVKLNPRNMDRADDLNSSIRKLLMGRIDLFASNELSANYALQNPEYLGQISKASAKIQTLKSYLAFSKKSNVSQEFISKFNQNLIKLKRNGEYQKILKEFHISLND